MKIVIVSLILGSIAGLSRDCGGGSCTLSLLMFLTTTFAISWVYLYKALRNNKKLQQKDNFLPILFNVMVIVITVFITWVVGMFLHSSFF